MTVEGRCPEELQILTVSQEHGTGSGLVSETVNLTIIRGLIQTRRAYRSR